jgi:hypothetical protein
MAALFFRCRCVHLVQGAQGHGASPDPKVDRRARRGSKRSLVFPLRLARDLPGITPEEFG